MPSMRELADNLRQVSIRNVSRAIINVRSTKEPIAMIGIRKPSLHFYTKQIVFYESSAPNGLVNLSERFTFDLRSNELDQPNYNSDSFLVVIDKYSKEKKHWTSINSQNLGTYGIYSLLRIKRSDLNLSAQKFKKGGIKSTWRIKKFENF
tara:strand:- start:47 stop:496 length:450 start_codon:yes stop_codon:yes gene_type:complete